MNVVLASASPRRRDLLNQLGLSFRVIVKDTSEVSIGEPGQVVVENARRKAEAVFQEVSEAEPGTLVIGADTIVVLDNKILGKPRDPAHALDMLRQLSGQVHCVTTGVAMISRDKDSTFFVNTQVRFRSLNDDEILAYVASGEPMDKAGAYGIQGIGGLFVEEIAGCYFNVVGLPVPRLALELRQYGIDVLRLRAQGRV